MTTEKSVYIPEDEKVKELYREFLVHLYNIININSKKENITTSERRMDSLARIVEGAGKCTAIYIDEKGIIIASNSVHKNSKTGTKASKHIKLIDQVMTYFNQVANLNGAPSLSKHEKLATRMALVTKLCDLILTDRKRDNKIREREIVENYVLNFFRKEHITTKEWRHALLQQNKYKNKIDIIEQVSRTIRDILKIEEFIKKETNTNNNFGMFIKNRTYQILRIGQKDVHAEMRILQYILETRQKNEQPDLAEDLFDLNLDDNNQDYVGISKLCCAHCSLAIETSNNIIKTRGSHGQIFEWNSDIVKEHAIFKKFIGEKAYQIYVSLDEKQKRLAKKYIFLDKKNLSNETIKTLNEIKNNLKESREMYADSSDSDVEYDEGEYFTQASPIYDTQRFSDSSLPSLKKDLLELGIDSEKLNIDHLKTIHTLIKYEVIQLKQFIEDKEKEKLKIIIENIHILNLLDFSHVEIEDYLTLDTIVLKNMFTKNYCRLLTADAIPLNDLLEFYNNSSKQKFKDLDDKNIIDIIIQNNLDIDVFSNMYDTNREKFDCFTDVRIKNLIMEDGFDKTSERYDNIEKTINGNTAIGAHVDIIDVLLGTLSKTGKALMACTYDSDHDEEREDFDIDNSHVSKLNNSRNTSNKSNEIS